jgi:hypothetical protein
MSMRILLLTLGWSVLAIVPARAIDYPAQPLPVYGGTGGTAFTRSCGADKVLTGLRYRYGILIDAIGLLCRPVNADGTLGSQVSVGTMVGGGGGDAYTMSCPSGEVAMGANFNHGTYVTGMMLHCRRWAPATRTYASSAAGGAGHIVNGRGYVSTSRFAEELCERTDQPFVAIRGRAAMFVDAVGFTCNEP